MSETTEPNYEAGADAILEADLKEAKEFREAGEKTVLLTDSEWDIILLELRAALAEVYPGSEPTTEKLKELIENIEKKLGR